MSPRKKTEQQAKSMLSGHKALYVDRAREALPLLVQLASGRRTATYQQFANLLKIRNPRTLNYVLGSVGSTLDELTKKWGGRRIPPVQALVYSKSTGVPGYGFEASTSWKGGKEKDSRETQQKHFATLQRAAFDYPDWGRVLQQLGLRRPTTTESTASASAASMHLEEQAPSIDAE